MAGVPNAVHGAFIRGSPVRQPNGAGPVAAGTENDGGGLVHLRHPAFALSDMPPGVVVASGGDIETVANQVSEIGEAGAVFLEAFVVKLSGLVPRDGIARVGKAAQHRGDIDGSDGRPARRSLASVF